MSAWIWFANERGRPPRAPTRPPVQRRFWRRLGGGMGCGLALVLLVGMSLTVRSQPLSLAEFPVTATSRSGQFIVHGRSSELPAPATTLSRIGTNAVIALRPDLLAVSAERVKHAVDRRLGANDRWGSRIHLQLRAPTRIEGPVAIQARVFRDGWQYQVVLPDQMEWDRLVRGLVEVVLLERANRANPGTECALVPLWLTEGMTRLILAEEGRDLVAEGATVLVRSERKRDPLAPVRLGLRGREPLPFSEFSLLTLNELGDPERFQEFQTSSALFTWEFLRTDEGRAMLQTFLNGLPVSLNWQTAFLKASNGTFQTLLDVEKWWAVNAADTLSTDLTQRWPRQRVLERLGELAVETTEVRADANGPAARQVLSLPELVVRWDFPTQREVLLRKLSQWRVLALRAPPDLVPLCADYVQVVSDYIRTRDRAGLGTTSRGALETRGNLVAAAVARRLGELQRRLDQEQEGSDASLPVP